VGFFCLIIYSSSGEILISNYFILGF
jgi:hypothetical protein